jgi:hypothetical protein
MHPDDFNGNHDRSNANSTPELPSGIDTLDDAIAYLQRARVTMGGKTKFRVALDEYTHVKDEYDKVEDIIMILGKKSLMTSPCPDGEGEGCVLLVH